MFIGMKTRLQQILFFLACVGASHLHAGTITAHVDRDAGEANVILYLFDSANTFGDLREPLRKEVYPLDGRKAYVMKDVAPGTYALVVHLDENRNGRIDRNFIGIPKEPVAFSNGYRPKGPPAYERAAFDLRDTDLNFNTMLEKPLGERGRLSAGLGMIARSSPYRGSDSVVASAFPALAYNGERVQWYGPDIQVSLAGTGNVRLAALGSYRIGVYEEDDSSFLEGLGDRDDTFMLGLGLQAELPGGVELKAAYAHDAADEIGGGEASLAMEKSFQFGLLRLSPEVGVNWISEDLSGHDFGVPASQAHDERPAYTPGSTTSVEFGTGLFVEVSRDWLIFANIAVELLSDDIQDSPIVDEDYVIKGFGAVSYVF